MSEKTLEEKARERDLHFLKEHVEGLVFYLNSLHPDFLGKDEALKKLLTWTPEYFDVEQFKKNPHYEEGDEKAPFFSEAFLYILLGKEDARTLLSLMKRALGIKGVGKL